MTNTSNTLYFINFAMTTWQYDVKIQSHEEDVGNNPVQQTDSSYYAYVSSWVSYVGGAIGKVGDTVGNIVTFNSYPKEHVEPHKLPAQRTDICDYSGKSEGYVYVQYLPYDGRYGIIHSAQMRSSACEDCYAFCKKHQIFPISVEFLTDNGFVGPYYVRSGEYKSYRIVPKATTIIKDGIIIIGVTNGDEPEYVNLKSLCNLNNINYKNMLELLDNELRALYCIEKSNFV